MSTADLSRMVIAIFGPTASGKTAVARGDRRRHPVRGRLRRLDAGLPGPADPHEPARSPDRARRRSGRSTTKAPSPSTSASHTRPSTARSRRGARRSSSAARASISALPSPTSSFRLHRRPAPATAGSASTTGSGPSRRTPLSPSAIRRRRRPFTPTTAGASSAPSSCTRRADRSHPRATGSGARRPATRR